MKLNGKLHDGLALLIFFFITMLFFGRLYTGKVLVQSDIQQYKGMSKEITDYRNADGEHIHWTNNMFGGMPTYLLGDSLYLNQSLPQFVNYTIRKIFPGVSGIFLIGLICFYVLMRAVSINRWLSIIGSFAFGSGTFVIASLVAGHTSKINAYAYAPLILAGLLYIFRKRYWAGLFCLAFGLAAQISVNHLQITFYTFLICLILFISEAIRIVRTDVKQLSKPLLFTTVAVVLALGVNYNKLYTIYQHSDYTIRGGNSVLDPSTEKSNGKNQAYDYATQWSYKPIETLTLLIPNFMGGTSNEHLGEKAHWYNEKSLPQHLRTNPPTYWGQMPFTGNPVYIGAVVLSLFILSLFILQPRWKWWVLASSVLLILLSWGKFSAVYDAFYFGFPFFNKFRTPMMALLLLGVTMPFLAILGLNKLLASHKLATFDKKKILISFGVSVGIIFLFGFAFLNMYSFNGAVDEQLRNAGLPNQLLDLLKKDRKMLLINDSLRSLFFVLFTGGLLYAFAIQKIKARYVVIGVALLTFIDLFFINKRYLNAEHFVEKNEYEHTFQPSPIDQKILQDEEEYYRVFNLSRNPFQDAITSYHHKSIGGYHAAKLQRYQDIIEKKLAKNDQQMLNALNTKYYIGQAEDGSLAYQQNDKAYGNAWFVNEVDYAKTPKDAMAKLDNTNLKNIAIIESDTKDKSFINQPIGTANQREIKLTSYHPEQMEYEVQILADQPNTQFAVFSDIYYLQPDGDGWHAYINGVESPIYRVDYIFRGLYVPSDTEKITFVYENNAFNKRSNISRIFSALIFLAAVLFFIKEFYINETR